MITVEKSTDVHATLQKVFHESNTGKKQYCYVSNAQGKEWLFAADNVCSVKLGLNIYEPQSQKGKMIKFILPYCKPIFSKKPIFGIKKVYANIDKNLEEILMQLFSCKHIYCSFFLGTPSVHQKIVIQVDDGRRILGYAKLSDNDDVKKSFEKEYQFLLWIREKGINCVPEPLLCNIEETGIFIQTSQKDTNSYSDPEINKTLVNFLLEMRDKTTSRIAFEDTDYYKLIQNYTGILEYYPGKKKQLKQQIESVLAEYSGKEVKFSAYHGDFTPWNTFYNPDKSLHVFDFEYAAKTYPPMLDLYHWFVSDCIFRLHMQADEIFKAFKSSHLQEYDNHAVANMKKYLISQIIFYLYRENDYPTGDVLRNLNIWGQLIDYFQ